MKLLKLSLLYRYRISGAVLQADKQVQGEVVAGIYCTEIIPKQKTPDRLDEDKAVDSWEKFTDQVKLEKFILI